MAEKTSINANGLVKPKSCYRPWWKLRFAVSLLIRACALWKSRPDMITYVIVGNMNYLFLSKDKRR